jgi:hypothetical protein
MKFPRSFAVWVCLLNISLQRGTTILLSVFVSETGIVRLRYHTKCMVSHVSKLSQTNNKRTVWQVHTFSVCERYVYFFDTLKRCPEIHPSLSPCPRIEVGNSPLPVCRWSRPHLNRKLSLSFYVALYCSHISLVDMGDRYVQVGVYIYVCVCISMGGRSCGGRLVEGGVVEVWSWASLGLVLGCGSD